MQSEVRCNTSRGWICAWTSVMSQIPAFVSRCHSTCMLFSGFVLFPLPSFSLLGFESEPSRTDKVFSPSFHSRSLQQRAAAAAQWKHQCSITSGAGLSRDLVTFDRFKTSAPPPIRFPEPPSSLCFQPCSFLFCFVYRFLLEKSYQSFTATSVVYKVFVNWFGWVIIKLYTLLGQSEAPTFSSRVSLWSAVDVCELVGRGRSWLRSLADPQAILKFQEVAHWSGMVRAPQQCHVLTAECSDRVSGMSPSDCECSPLSKHQHRLFILLPEDDLCLRRLAIQKTGRSCSLVSHWTITFHSFKSITSYSCCLCGCSVWDVTNWHSEYNVFTHYEAIRLCHVIVGVHWKCKGKLFIFNLFIC